MRAQDLMVASVLVDRRRELLDLIHQLNDINGGMERMLPKKILDYVDSIDASKGLTVLAIEALAKIEADIESLGVELTKEAA